MTLLCRFGLNGRALILQAAQRAAKKRKISHLASQDSDSATVHTVEELRSTPSTATHEQHSPQLALPAGIETNDRNCKQDIRASAASEVVQPGVQKQPTPQNAPRRSDVLSTAATDALIDGLDPHDQPLVAYINRSSIPRILRQVRCSPLLVCVHACWTWCVSELWVLACGLSTTSSFSDRAAEGFRAFVPQLALFDDTRSLLQPVLAQIRAQNILWPGTPK